jgi:hypothetical protein
VTRFQFPIAQTLLRWKLQSESESAKHVPAWSPQEGLENTWFTSIKKNPFNRFVQVHVID